MEILKADDSRYRAVVLCGDPLLLRLLEIELTQCGISTVSEDVGGDLWLIDLDDYGNSLARCPEKNAILCWSHKGMSAVSSLVGAREGVCFLKRPFGLSELELCLRRLLSGQWGAWDHPWEMFRALLPAEATASGSIPRGVAMIYPLSQGLVAVGQEQITLTPREWALFSCLWEARGVTVPKTVLWEALCAARDAQGMPVTNTLEVYMCHLRRKLEKPLARRLILTERGKGYRLDI